MVGQSFATRSGSTWKNCVRVEESQCRPATMTAPAQVRNKKGEWMKPSNVLAAEIVAVLMQEEDPEARGSMRQQYGIYSDKMYGVPMRRLLEIAKPLATNHELALSLWEEGSYEARTIAALVDDPQQVSRAQMQLWCADFDNWAIVDTACFRLFDQTPYAWSMIDEWVDGEKLFVRRAGFALLWALALHDHNSPDLNFQRALVHVRSKANDPRPLVGKAIIMAMRAIAAKRPALRDDVLRVASDLSEDKDPVVRRVGRPIKRSLTIKKR